MRNFIILLTILLGINSAEAQRTIEPVEGYSPQIGVLVSMLNDMKSRVENTVKNMTTEQLDYLIDDESNTIGALVWHLASTEALYHALSFEGREDFNDKENEEWGIAMNLGDEARKNITGHDAQYYLDKYDKVRKKTLEILKTKDDSWLNETILDGSMNQHWAWYHVMEHQSSHLGQILLIRKRVTTK